MQKIQGLARCAENRVKVIVRPLVAVGALLGAVLVIPNANDNGTVSASGGSRFVSGSLSLRNTLRPAPVRPEQVSPTATAAPSPTPSLPDPVMLLGRTVDAYGRLKSVHYHTTDEQLVKESNRTTLEVTGDAACLSTAKPTGPVGHPQVAFTARVKGSTGVVGSAPTKTLSASYIVVKKNAWKKAKATKNRWRKVSLAKTTLFGLRLADENPLLCTGGTGTGGSPGSGSNGSARDVVNLGSEIFQGIPVWHVRFIVPGTTSSTQQVEVFYDILLSQVKFMPYRITAHFETADISFTEIQVLTKPNKKVTVKAPRVGSSKP